jgi:hypothetical protein
MADVQSKSEKTAETMQRAADTAQAAADTAQDKADAAQGQATGPKEPPAGGWPKYSEDKAYDARRAGLLPANPAADKKVLAARQAKAEAEAEARRKEVEARKRRAGVQAP